MLGTLNEPPQGPFEPIFLDELDTRGISHAWSTDAPFTVNEKILNVVLSFLGAILWAYVSARLVEVIVNANPEGLAFRNHLDGLNRFCRFHQLPQAMAMKLRAFAHERKLIMQAESNLAVASTFSPKLQALVAWDAQREWLSQIRFLNLDSEADHAYRRTLRMPREIKSMQVIRTRVAQALKPALYAPREVIPGRRLYVIIGGYATYCGRPLGEGASFGSQDCLLRSEHVRRRLAISVNHLHVLSIGPDEISELCIGFPRQFLEMRLWAIKRLIIEALPKRARALMNFERQSRDQWSAGAAAGSGKALPAPGPRPGPVRLLPRSGGAAAVGGKQYQTATVMSPAVPPATHVQPPPAMIVDVRRSPNGHSGSPQQGRSGRSPPARERSPLPDISQRIYL